METAAYIRSVGVLPAGADEPRKGHPWDLPVVRAGCEGPAEA